VGVEKKKKKRVRARDRIGPGISGITVTSGFGVEGKRRVGRITEKGRTSVGSAYAT